MNECWINVYRYINGQTRYGDDAFNLITSKAIAVNAVRNGCILLYRIHVKLKPIKLADLGRDYEWMK